MNHSRSTTIVFMALLLISVASCNKKGCTDISAENYDPEATENDGSCEYASNTNNNGNESELPETYIVFDSDTFYQSGTSVLPDQNAYRYQINLTTEEELSTTGNDGSAVATMALALTFKEKPTASGTAFFSKSRFPSEVNDSLNFYLSVFFNTGHEYEGENFLSPSSGMMDYTIEGGKLNATIPNQEMILESEQTQRVTLNGGTLKIDW